jgi:cation diffusion facilitator family transporter
MALTDWLVKLFIKDYNDIKQAAVRERYGKLAGIVGIITNVFLFILKIIAGSVFNSIAITADAINSISDAGSSIITIVGFKISIKPADDEHPYGHARAEYISGFLISIIIIQLGLELIESSVKKILNPEPVVFSYLTVVILLVSALIKLWQGKFNKTIGSRIDSAALKAAGTDSINDVISTISVLAAIIFAYATGIQIDGYMGIAVALFIIYSGIKLISETINPLLGHAPDKDLVEGLCKKILSYDGVIGLHDLMVHSYGPNKWYASVHVEVPSDQDLLKSHDIIDTIEKDVLAEWDIHLVIHMDPIVTDDELTNTVRGKVEQIIKELDPSLSMHDFRMVTGPTHSNLIFDVLLSVSYKERDEKIRDKIQKEVYKIDPTYNCVITLDRNYTSTTSINL